MQLRTVALIPLFLFATLSVAWCQAVPLALDDPVIASALGYIALHQNADGGFGQLGESDLSTTSRAVEALAAAGRDPLSYEVGGKGPDDFLLSVSEAVFAGEYGTNPVADRINMILGVAACGLDAADFGGRDHVTALLSEQNKTTNAFGTGPSDTAYAILALLAGGIDKDNQNLQRARDYLEASQLSDGTFEYVTGWGPDSNTHAIVIIALRKMGSCTGCFKTAVGAIPNFQNGTNRGFYYQDIFSTDSDVSSTALGIQAILAAANDPQGSPYAVGAESPAKFILSMQNRTTGEFFDPWGSLRPTTLAVPALLGKLTPGIHMPEVSVAASVLLLLVLLKGGLGGLRKD